jgi:uncharacterized membrane protein
MSDVAQDSVSNTRSVTNNLKIRKIEYSDIVESLGRGMRDFKDNPRYGLAIGGFYAIGGWLLYALLYHFELPYLFYPLTTGFALVAPFAAAGLYEVSRRVERGEPLSWGAVLGSMRLCCGKDLAWMAVVTGFALIVWVDFAVFLYLMFFGLKAVSAQELFQTILTTPTGALFFFVGNLFGAFFAVSVFSLTAVSFPLLYDRDVDFVTAMITSVKAVVQNPRPMLSWLFVVGLALIASVVTLFAGLFIALPVLGHATWHLYRQLIAPDETAAAA